MISTVSVSSFWEIGLWGNVSTFNNPRATAKDFSERLIWVCKKDLGHRMGRTYRDVFIRCTEWIEADDTDSLDSNNREDDLMR